MSGHRWTTAILCITGLLGTVVPAGAHGWRTPLAWQQVVDSTYSGPLAGQMKHVGWVRDRNRNFIDDVIEHRFTSRDSVDVIVELNRHLTRADLIANFSSLGRIRYIGRVLTYVLLDNVPFSRMDTLAARPYVSMVEWQAPSAPQLVYATRAIEARKSPEYSPSTAEDMGLDGKGIVIAVLDTGVDDFVRGASPARGNPAIATSVCGFDAVAYDDSKNLNNVDDSCEGAPVGDGDCTSVDDEPYDGTKNPCAQDGSTCTGHGTHVAGAALAVGVDDSGCWGAVANRPDEEVKDGPPYCLGVAPGASLADIRVCEDDNTCNSSDVQEGLDWLALHAVDLQIRVANLSFVSCERDDGTSTLSEEVNYLVSLGIVVVAAHGNAGGCSTTDPDLLCDATDTLRQSLPPGAASDAITVSAVNDGNTVDRTGDAPYTGSLHGPRCDFDVTTLNVDALKPDVNAPGQGIFVPKSGSTSGQYEVGEGTSLAAPQVAGAAAILLQKNPSLDPGTVKELLRVTADPSNNSPAYAGSGLPSSYAAWDRVRGAGTVRVGEALKKMETLDVGFPSCVGDPGSSSLPCLLADPRPPWGNDLDILVDPEITVSGVENTMTARVANNESLEAEVEIVFGVYTFGTGTAEFYEVGRQRVTLGSSEIKEVSQTWIPASDTHQCAQVRLIYGPDSKIWNNLTQRNLTVVAGGSSALMSSSAPRMFPPEKPSAAWKSPAAVAVQIENPWRRPAAFKIRTKSTRPRWRCSATPSSLSIDPAIDRSHEVRVRVQPPPGAGPDEWTDCEVLVLGRPRGASRFRPVGGVTVRGVQPGTCSAQVRVVDAEGRPMPGVRVEFRRAFRVVDPTGIAKPDHSAVTDEQGDFQLAFGSHVPYRVRLSASGLPPREFAMSLSCKETQPVVIEYGPARAHRRR